MGITKCLGNRFLLLMLFFSVFAFGQNIEKLKLLNDSDSLFVKSFVSEMFPNHNTIYKKDKFSRVSFLLIPSNATEQDRLDYDRGNHCKKCVLVEFKKFTKGGNSDLNIQGETYYIFEQVTGDFLSMFPYWRTNVEPNATTDKTYEEYPVYAYKDLKNKIFLLFRKTDMGKWILRNESARSQPW